MAKGSSQVTVNRKAYHDYHIQESLEAGIVLKGSEIESIRAGKANLSDSHAKPGKGGGCIMLGGDPAQPANGKHALEPLPSLSALQLFQDAVRFSQPIVHSHLLEHPLSLFQVFQSLFPLASVGIEFS